MWAQYYLALPIAECPPFEHEHKLVLLKEKVLFVTYRFEFYPIDHPIHPVKHRLGLLECWSCTVECLIHISWDLDAESQFLSIIFEECYNMIQ